MKPREHREKLGLTQEEYAQKVGTTETSIYRIENGIQKPGLKIINNYYKFSKGKVTSQDFA